jgi:hypothetical protein
MKTEHIPAKDQHSTVTGVRVAAGQAAREPRPRTSPVRWQSGSSGNGESSQRSTPTRLAL